MTEIKYKICNLCNLKKPVYDFGMSRAYFDGIVSRCKICQKNSINKSEIQKLRAIVIHDGACIWSQNNRKKYKN